MLPVKRVYVFVFVGLLLTGIVMVGLYALDQHLHRKFDQVATLNRAGYRGALVGPKVPEEKRVFLMGGSTALGYGVYADQTIAAYLEQALNGNANNGVRYSVVNLGFNNTGAAALSSDLEYYSALEPDAVILYTGYDDLGVNRFRGRHESTFFRLSGYYPVFPLIITEKAKLLRYHSWGRWSQYKTVFRAGQRTEPAQRGFSPTAPQQWDWSYYCGEMRKAINLALSENRKIIVVTEPYVSAQHFDQQKALRTMIETEFLGEQKITYVDLGQLINPADQEFATDGMHLNARGNRLIAEQLAPVVQKQIR